MPYGVIKGGNMEGKEKMVFHALLMAAWVGLWMTGPEDPMATYGRYDWIWFWLGFVAIVFFFVRALSEYVQRRDAEKRAREWRRRDTRPDR
jgi:hypothetical protein